MSSTVAAVGPLKSNLQKRKPTIDEIFEAKRSSYSIYNLRNEFNQLLLRKREWIYRQRRGSLLVDSGRIDEENVMNEFAPFYRKVSNAPMSIEEHADQLMLIEEIIKESMIIEWPRSVPGMGPGGEEEVVEVDSAPLIHRARNVVKCRTSHPTMRVKICAIGKCGDDEFQPKTVETFYRATLVKMANEGHETRQVAGRIILTQREGTPATKSVDQSGAIVNGEGRLVASQAAADTHTYLLLDKFGELQAKTTNFKFENGVLCATFPEMGVTLNSMVDRRQLATRYAVQVEVALNIDNKLIVHHTILSHPFLIAITNDQTEPLLLSIFWNRLLSSDVVVGDSPSDTIPLTNTNNSHQFEDPVDSLTESPPIPWKMLRQAIRNFAKAQYPSARSFSQSELRHLQCMILLPRFLSSPSVEDCNRQEQNVYGNVLEKSPRMSHLEKIRHRLLSEDISMDVLIEKREFMTDHCISLLDMTTELRHSAWQWLFKATEMLMDVGHKLCPIPISGEKKGNKTKKQMAAVEEFQTMTSLFNKGLLTMSSPLHVRSVFQEIATPSSESETRVMIMRFCDENAGYLSFGFGFDEGKQLFGSLSSDQIKDFKQGLPEVLMDEQFPSKYEKMMKTEFRESPSGGNEYELSIPKKKSIFNYYRTMRMQNESISTADNSTIRINPLTGDRLNRTISACLSENGNGDSRVAAISLSNNDERTSPPVPHPLADTSAEFLKSLLQSQIQSLGHVQSLNGLETLPFLSQSVLPHLPTLQPTNIFNSLGHVNQMNLQQLLRGMQGFQDISTPHSQNEMSSRESSYGAESPINIPQLMETSVDKNLEETSASQNREEEDE